MTRHKVLVFGIDGATFDIIEPAVRAGRMPALAALMNDGCWGRLHSTIHPITPMAWTGFATGTNAGKHGIYDFSRLTPDGVALNDGSNRRRPAIWSILSSEQRPSVVVNVPFTYPPEQIHGVMIPGFEAPQVRREVFHPESIYDNLIEKFGKYDFDWTFPIGRTRDVPAYLEHCRRTIDHRGETGLHLLKTQPWDFFMTVFSTPDHIQHVFWKEPGGLEVITDIYEQCDRWLAKFLEAVEDDVTVVVMSDHGFGPVDHVVSLDNWLAKEGFLARRPRSLKRSTIGAVKRTLRKALPTRLRKLISWRLAALKNRVDAAEMSGAIDWSRTQAFSFGMYGNIYINLQGRQRQGIVDPADYDRLCQEISQRLLQLQAPDGTPVVEQVHRKSELYHGPHTDSAPDLVVQWRDYACYTKQGLGEGDEVFAESLMIEASGYSHTGTHRLDGIFLARGPNIAAGRETPAHIMDLAPTILSILGASLPPDLDGRVLDEIFLDSELVRTGYSEQPVEAAATKAPAAMSDDEEQALRERLRSLGYIE